MIRRPLLVLAGFLVAVSAVFTACGDEEDSSARSPAEGVDEVVRQILRSDEPDVAPGQEIVLSRVIVPAGMSIAPHTHPGIQMAVIVQGTLTYTVIDGEVTVTHHSATPDETTEVVSSGGTVELRPGSTVLEDPGMVHEAHNNGSEFVVIYLSSLFPIGEPASSPAE